MAPPKKKKPVRRAAPGDAPAPQPPEANAMRLLPGGTVTFLLTDIEGSTRLWAEHPEPMRAALARHDGLLHQAIASHGGFVFKTVGDGFYAAFASTPDALACALAAQRALAAEPWPAETALRARMALHTGQAEPSGEDYLGPTLNRAARLLAIGWGGQTLLSASAGELTRDHLPEGAHLRDLGAHRLKDLSRTEQVFQVLAPGLPAEFPPLRSLSSPTLRHNLPAQATSFLGRAQEMEDVQRLVMSHRLVTLTGPGGTGKTRLSVQVAAEKLTGDGDGVWLVELAPLADPALVPQAVAQVLGVREEPGLPLARSLVRALQEKRLLLVLDNCEHLVAACAALADALLRACPGVHLLASSREALGVPGEQVYRVPPLALPDTARPVTVESLSQYAAVALFIDRARLVSPGFHVSDANAPAVAQICVRLDGIPLAIELAAARIRMLTAEEINARLDDRFRLLTGGSRTVLPRQQTLRALVDWSYALLSDTEKTLLRRLSVFAGGWTLEAAEAVGAGGEEEEIEEWQVLDGLTSLADKSLISYGADGEARYRLLETVRHYASEKLAESGEGADTRRRHLAWFLGLAERARPLLRGPEQADWLDRLEDDHDNLRAALAESLEDGESADPGLRLAGALRPFWVTRGYLSEGQGWCTRLLEVSAGSPGSASTDARAGARVTEGEMAMRQAEYPTAEAAFAEARALFHHLGDARGEAEALQGLGQTSLYRQDYAASRAFFAEALAKCEAAGDEHGRAAALHGLGNTAQRTGRPEEAERLLRQALALRLVLGNEAATAGTLGSLGQLAAGRGDHAEAGRLIREVVRRYDRIGQHSLMALCLTNLSQIAEARGRTERAACLLAAAGVLRARFNFRIPPLEQAAHEETLAEMRAQLGEAPFQAAWDRGQGFTWEETLAYALSDEEEAA